MPLFVRKNLQAREISDIISPIAGLIGSSTALLFYSALDSLLVIVLAKNHR
jgi:hypothetical protein